MKNAISFIANKNIIVLSNVKKTQDSVLWSSHLSVLIKERVRVLTILNDMDYYDFFGFTHHIKRKGHTLSFFTIGHKSTSVHK